MRIREIIFHNFETKILNHFIIKSVVKAYITMLWLQGTSSKVVDLRNRRNIDNKNKKRNKAKLILR